MSELTALILEDLLDLYFEDVRQDAYDDGYGDGYDCACTRDQFEDEISEFY